MDENGQNITNDYKTELRKYYDMIDEVTEKYSHLGSKDGIFQNDVSLRKVFEDLGWPK